MTSGGGWYEYPLNDKLSVMCLNSIYWDDRGVSDFIEAKMDPLAKTAPA
jgi:hypothetical protein